MKKVFLTLMVLFMAILPAFSGNVTIQTAQHTAQSFLNSKMEVNPEIHLIDFSEKALFPNFYVFGNEHCFVIISADDGAKPVLGYSTDSGFGMNSLPDDVRDWLKAYNDEITSAMELRVEATPGIRSEWESLLSGRGLEPKSSTSVNPLITTHWHQYAPYNNLCPADSNASNGHAKAGCGAIAMAQFMKYWEHPVSGVGSYSYTPSNHPEYGVQYANFGEMVYDWNNMLDSYSNGFNDAEALAVATLVYHCGVSVNMNYGPSGSACNSSVIDDALMTYFDYSPNSEYVFKGTIPDDRWKAMLKNDLDLGWPLIYRGQTVIGDGHIFVCDGYDAIDYFHINWGHGNGGGYGGWDGYFAIGSLYEHNTNYSYNNAAIFNSIPNYLNNDPDPLIYSINEDGFSVTVIGHRDGTTASGTINFPMNKTLGGTTYSVTAIGDNAFSNCSGFVGSLTIPNSVTEIGENAFSGCSGFTGSLTIPNSVTSIGSNAFSGCSFDGLSINMTRIPSWFASNCGGQFNGSLTIGNSVTSIGFSAFEGCGSFTGNLTIGNSVTTIEYSAFYNCSGFNGSLTIGNSVTTIGDWAFYNCSGFAGELTMTHEAEVGEGAFYNCSNLAGSPSIVLTGEIGGNAFSGCSALAAEITIGSDVVAVGELAFYNCSSIAAVHYDVIDCTDYSYNNSPFQGCSGTLTIGSNVERIPVYMFYNAAFTGSLTIPNSVTTIGQGAFLGCSGFTGNLTIPNSVTTIGGGAFSDCSGFTGSLTIGNSVTSIGGSAFSYCSGFTGDLIIPNSMTTIGVSAFMNCNGFTGSLTIPNSVVEIGFNAFQGCSGFTGSLAIPNSLTTIEWNVFRNCSGFTGSLIIPNSVATIESGAFSGCSSFTGSLTIGESVTLIEYEAFRDCNGFTSILSHAEEPPTLGNNIFGSWNSNTPVYVPCGFEEAYSSISWGGFNNFIGWCGGTVTHFAEGWNWWSTCIEQEGIEGLGMLQDGLDGNGISIRSQADGYIDYYAGYGWYGSLSSINNESSYKIKTEAPCSVAMTGRGAVPSQHPIALSHGWTWMGYVPSTAMDVNEALSGLNAVQGDMLKSQQGYADYYPNYGWFGSLNTIEPGMGLMYYSSSNQPKTLVYPEGERGVEQKANYTADNNHWVPDMHAYPHNMTVTAIIELDGEELRAENYELAAFAADECRGSVRLMYVEPIDRWVAFLTIAGEDAANLNFILYDIETGMEYSGSEETLNYETDAMVGTMGEPYIVRFRNAASEDEKSSHLSIFPNPANDILNIRGEEISRVMVYDATGQMMEDRVVGEKDVVRIDVKDYSIGVFIVKIFFGDGFTIRRFVKQ